MTNPAPEQSESAVGIVVVDHGSRRTESNDLLLQVAALFQQVSGYAIVEPAHMELAEPTITQAFARCVEQGATLVVVHPYFLSPGRHWSQDIPRLAAEAAAQHPGIRYLVTSPLGLHRQMADVMRHRIETCLSHTQVDGPACDLCAASGGCQIQGGSA